MLFYISLLNQRFVFDEYKLPALLVLDVLASPGFFTSSLSNHPSKDAWCFRVSATMSNAGRLRTENSASVTRGSSCCTWETTFGFVTIPHWDRAAWFSSFTSQQKIFWAESSHCHSTEVKLTDTSLNDTSPCDLFISCCSWKPDENCTGAAATPSLGRTGPWRAHRLGCPEITTQGCSPDKDNLRLWAEWPSFLYTDLVTCNLAEPVY